MLAPRERAARVRQLFDLAVDTPWEDLDLLLSNHVGDDHTLIAEVKALLAADAAAGRHDASSAAIGLPLPFAHPLLAQLQGESRVPLVASDLPILRTVTLLDSEPQLVQRRSALPSSSSLVGRLLAHYRVESLLGAGGMGVVYRARDLALGRMAAVKVLPDIIAAGLRERLLAEADAISRLQHPAIATYYESGQAGDLSFIAMEFVAGETLRHRINRGPVRVAEALAWTACVLEALSHAHAAGILHRDIKPENIMITAAQSAKLLDFGLAKHLLLEDGETAVTAHTAGAIAGTLGYMSPEQIRQESQDVRSDVFQVGAVLYEMLTGRPAFPGESAAERLFAVLARDPDPISDPDLSPQLAATVMRSLARAPEQRHASASALLSDLRDVVTGGWAVQLPNIIAILDFDNLTKDPDKAWIATGLAESVSAEIRKSAAIDIVPRERILRARQSGDGSAESGATAIGLRLGCRWVLTGTYQTAGEAIRVTLTLIETATGETLLADKFDGLLRDLFQVQDRVAAAVLSILNLTPAASPLPRRPSLSAYEAYARGRRLFLRLEKGTLDQAKQLYEDAVRLEPQYAAALCGLAGIYAMQFTFTTDPEVLATAETYSKRAIAADAASAEAWTWLGYTAFRLDRPTEAYDAWCRAITLDPSYFFGYYFAGGVGHLLGKDSEGVRLLQRAVALEPGVSFPVWVLGCLHMHYGRHDEAVWSFERAGHLERVEGASQWPGGQGYHGECLRRIGKLSAARARCLTSLDNVEQSDHMYRDTNRVISLIALGRTCLQQRDVTGARAAYSQALAHVQGRQRMLGGGWLAVQALAGLARANRESRFFQDATNLFERRDRFDFSWFWLCTKDITLLDLSRAAVTLGRDDAAEFRDRAARLGSFEAASGLP
jgi:serine/threonine-protein kinase